MTEVVLPPHKQVHVHGFALKQVSDGRVVFHKTPRESAARSINRLMVPPRRYVVRFVRGKWAVVQPRWIETSPGMSSGRIEHVQVSPILRTAREAKRVAIVQAAIDG